MRTRRVVGELMGPHNCTHHGGGVLNGTEVTRAPYLYPSLEQALHPSGCGLITVSRQESHPGFQAGSTRISRSPLLALQQGKSANLNHRADDLKPLPGPEVKRSQPRVQICCQLTLLLEGSSTTNKRATGCHSF